MIVGFIGLGTMGAPMARNILAKGHRLIVADVQPAAVAALIAAGATAAATPRDVAEASGIVITMLPDAPDVERVALGPDGIVAGIKPGAIVELHDGGGDRSTTVAALPKIIRGIRGRGLRLRAIR